MRKNLTQPWSYNRKWMKNKREIEERESTESEREKTRERERERNERMREKERGKKIKGVGGVYILPRKGSLVNWQLYHQIIFYSFPKMNLISKYLSRKRWNWYD